MKGRSVAHAEPPDPPALSGRSSKGSALVLAQVLDVRIDGEGLTARLSIERDTIEATIAPWVDIAVVNGARARGEPVLVQHGADGGQVVGALRTRAIPGIDRAEEYVIEADRVRIECAHEVSLSSGTAQLVLRARGVVETIATNITARATGVHKLIGRMLHLN